MQLHRDRSVVAAFVTVCRQMSHLPCSRMLDQTRKSRKHANGGEGIDVRFAAELELFRVSLLSLKCRRLAAVHTYYRLQATTSQEVSETRQSPTARSSTEVSALCNLDAHG